MSEENSERSDGVTKSQTKRRGNEAAEATPPKLAKTTDSTVSLPTTSSPLASQREKDEEGEEDLKRRCIRRKIFGELDTVIECDTDRFRRFKDCAKEFLPDGSVSEDDDVHDILKKFEDAGKIEPGNYETLKEILKRANLPDALKFVSRAEGEGALSSGTSITKDPIKAVSEKYIADCIKHRGEKFVETEPCKVARKNIDNHKTLLILGGMGDGKTFVVEYIALYMFEKGYHPIPCQSATDIPRYVEQVQDKSINLLFVFDNIIGKFYTERIHMGEWENMEYLSMYLEKGSPHKFVFASRESLWDNCRDDLKEKSFFCTKVRATSAALSFKDKKDMLEIYSLHSRNLTDAHKDEILKNENPISFGHCCHLMYKYDANADAGLSGEKLVQLFFKPLSYLCSEIENMSDSARGDFAVLCLTMLCRGKVECKELAKTLAKVTPFVREKIDQIVSTTGCEYGQLHRCAKNLASTGTYLKKQENNFTFSHDCIHEAVIMVYSRDHLCHLMDNLNIDMFIECARPDSYKVEQEEFAIVISKDYYDDLAKNFVEAASNGHLEHVFKNLCMGDKAFQSVFCRYVKTLQSSALDDFRQSKHSLLDRCALYYVARLGSKELLEILIGDSPVKCKCDCREALCLLRGAAEGNVVEIVKHVLRSYKRTKEQIHEAAKSASKAGSVDVLKILWEYIADEPTYDDQRAQTIEDCLWVACWHNRREILIYLLKIGGTGCKSDPCLCEEKIPKLFRNSHKVIVQTLLYHGANINQSGHKGNTCLHKAARKGEDDTVIYIIEKGLSVNTPNEKGISPLHLAANSLRPKVVTTLLEKGAQINMKDEWNFTPLHSVLIRDIQSSKKLAKRTEVLDTLLSYSADVNTADKWNRTAVSLTKEKGMSDIFQIFAAHNIDMTTSVGEHLPFRKPEPLAKAIGISYKTGE